MTRTNRALRLCAFAALGAGALLAALRWALQRERTLAREERMGGIPAAEIRAAIARANRSYLDALIHNDAYAYAQLFAEDCLYMPALGPIARGRAAVESNVAQTLKLIRFTGGDITTLEMHVDGDCVYEVGTYRFEVLAEGSQKNLSGRYIGVWRRIESEWKLMVDLSQPDAAAA